MAGLLTAPGMAAAQVGATCFGGVTVGAQAIAFGSYSPISGAPLPGLGSINVACNLGLGGTVSIALSAGASGNAAARQMVGPGGQRLAYNLYTNAAYTAIWTDSVATAPQFTLVRQGLLNWGVTAPVYARIPGGQTGVVPGSYSDSILATVTF